MPLRIREIQAVLRQDYSALMRIEPSCRSAQTTGIEALQSEHQTRINQGKPQVDQIDQMIASADASRNKALCEIEPRREAIARRLRTASAEITDMT